VRPHRCSFVAFSKKVVPSSLSENTHLGNLRLDGGGGRLRPGSRFVGLDARVAVLAGELRALVEVVRQESRHLAAGSCLRLIDFAYHSTLGLRVRKKRRRRFRVRVYGRWCMVYGVRCRVWGVGCRAASLEVRRRYSQVSFAPLSKCIDRNRDTCEAVPRRARI